MDSVSLARVKEILFRTVILERRNRGRTHTLADDTEACDYCENDDEVDVEKFLDNVSNWVVEKDASFFNGADDVVVMSGHDFDGGTIGLAWLGTVCATWAQNVNEVRYTNSLRYSAATVAHEIGHNLGFPHDGDGDSGTRVALLLD